MESPPRPHPLTLRFPPEWERAFAAATAQRYLVQARFATAIAFVNLLAVAAWFYFTVPAESGGMALGRMFAIGALPAGVAFLCTLHPAFPRIRSLVLSGAILTTGLAVGAIALAEPTNLGGTVATVGMVVILLFGFVFMGPALAVAAPSGLVVVLFGLYATGMAQVGWAYTSAYWLGMVSAYLGALGAGYFVEKFGRRDFVQQRLLDAERERSERLLLNVLPSAIAERLKAGEEPIADAFPDTTVLFADIVDFTGIASRVSPDEMVETLNQVFTTFDKLVADHGLEKIKTVGDAYMVVGGLPEPRPDHAEAVAELALAMQAALRDRVAPTGDPLRVRIGINTGPVVAGVIGTAKFAYDLWGDAVNTASRMESHGVPDGIQVTQSTYEKLRADYVLVERGPIEVKGKGVMPTYLLLGHKSAAVPVA